MARPDPVVVKWSEFKEAHPVLLDGLDMGEATFVYDRARKAIEADPSNSQARAEWSRAKADLVAARQFERLNRRRT